jgi:hypothetical protein
VALSTLSHDSTGLIGTMGMSFAVAVSIMYMASLHFHPSLRSILIIKEIKSIELQERLSRDSPPVSQSGMFGRSA